MHGTFLIFLHEATAAGLKLTQMTFFWKILFSELEKGAQNEFFEFKTELVH